jgi:hypothetical protein
MEEKNEEKKDVFKDYQPKVIKHLNKDQNIERFRSKRKSERSVRDINLIRENQPIRIFLSGNYVVSNFQPSNLPTSKVGTFNFTPLLSWPRSNILLLLHPHLQHLVTP